MEGKERGNNLAIVIKQAKVSYHLAKLAKPVDKYR